MEKDIRIEVSQLDWKSLENELGKDNIRLPGGGDEKAFFSYGEPVSATVMLSVSAITVFAIWLIKRHKYNKSVMILTYKNARGEELKFESSTFDFDDGELNPQLINKLGSVIRMALKIESVGDIDGLEEPTAAPANDES